MGCNGFPRVVYYGNTLSFAATMSLKQLSQPTKFERAPALVTLQARLRDQQNSTIMQRSPAVKEMKNKQAVR